MDSKELEIIRTHVLSASVRDAAKVFGCGRSVRTWKKWEQGEHPVPEDVEEMLLNFLVSLEAHIEAVKLQIDEGQSPDLSFPESEDKDYGYFLRKCTSVYFTIMELIP